ncbi:MAG: DUF3800 domain-containing protein [Parcubacteria group bacterium]|nr:DUF3800 domain-containing protein [Parcubacteria group bacterium]
MQKLYCYVDESGQDTKGKFFVVSVVVLEENRKQLLQELERIEAESGKKNVKWHKARHLFREIYFEKIARTSLFENTIFFETFIDGTYYLKMTSYATAKAILKKANEKTYTASIYVDGFNKKEITKFSKELRALQIKKRKVKGVGRDENNAFIRFADALCGLVRDVEDGRESAIKMLRRLQKKKVVDTL